MRILVGIIIGAVIAITWPEQTQHAHEWSRAQIHQLSSRIAQHTDDTAVIVLPWEDNQ